MVARLERSGHPTPGRQQVFSTKESYEEPLKAARSRGARGGHIAVLAFAGTSLADPPDTLISPPNHRHFIVTPDGGVVPVGPQICGNPEMQLAFNAFHYNVHHSEVPGIGDVPTLGPQDGAPGLHNGLGAEVIGVRGCG